MGLIQPFAVKNELTNADLTLTADPGESFLVKDIMTHHGDEHYCTLTIDKTTVGYFRQATVLGAHVFRQAAWNRHSHGISLNIDAPGNTDGPYKVINVAGDNISLGMHATAGAPVAGKYRFNEAVQNVTGGRIETLIQFLSKKGIWKGFPVAEGETLKLSGVKKSTGHPTQVVVYEIHEAGDMTPEMENGSKSPTYMFLNYGDCTSAISAAGDNLFNRSVSPAEFPAFPFGDVVPAKHEIEILGICATPFAAKENDETTYLYTQYMKLVRGREVLFDEDRNGILFQNYQLSLTGRADSYGQGFSMVGGKSEYDLNDPLMFDPPLKFGPGDELGIYVTTVALNNTGTIETDQHQICLIERVTRLE